VKIRIYTEELAARDNRTLVRNESSVHYLVTICKVNTTRVFYGYVGVSFTDGAKTIKNKTHGTVL
jgi:hypothetical protein